MNAGQTKVCQALLDNVPENIKHTLWVIMAFKLLQELKEGKQ